MPRMVLANNATATHRRTYFDLRDATDGITAELGEAGGQPQISTNGGAWTNTGIGTLTSIGNGRYYADVTQAAIGTAGDVIETRFKSAATAESPGDTFQVVAFDLNDIVRLGLTALPNVVVEGAGGLFTRGTGAGQINQSANGQIDANAERLNNVAQSLLDLKDFADAGYDPGTNKVQGVVLTDTVTALTGHTNQTGDNFARIGINGAGLSFLGGMSTGMKAEVNAEADTALTDYDAPTRTEATADKDEILAAIPADLTSGTADSGTTTTMVDAVRTEGDTDYWKDSWIKFTSGTISGQTRLITGFNPATDTITFSPVTTQPVGTNTYEIIPAAVIAAISGHTAQTADHTAGIADIPTVSEFDARTLLAASYFNSAVDAVATVTNLTNLPSIPANWITAAGIAANALDNKGNWSLASVVGALNDAAVTGDPTTGDTIMQYLKQVINLLAGTAGIGTMPPAQAPANAINLFEMVRAIYDDTNSLEGTKIPDTLSLANINIEVDNSMVTYGLDHLLFAAVAGVDITDDSIIAQLVSASATADWDDFVNITDSLQALRDRGDAAWTTGAGTGLTPLASGTAQGGTSSTIQLASGESFANDEMNGNIVKITSGTGVGQSRTIIAYVGATDTATITPNWTTTPDATSVYEIVEGSVNIAAVSNVAEDLPTASALATAQTDLDTITGSDGVTLATTQGNYAPSKAGDAMTLTAAATSAQLVDDVWDEVLTGGTHNVTNSAGRRLRIIQELGSYHAGAVWIDTVNGVAGTTNFENGVDILPSDTIADANTIAASIGLGRFEVAPGSAITFAATQTNETWMGRDWTLALGGQNISGSFIFGAIVSGIGTGTAGYELEECDIGAVTLDNDGHFELCALTGTFTIGQAGTFTFHSCFTESGSAITIDFAGLGATTVHLFDFNGEINFKNMATGDTVHITGGGDITTETCTAGTIDHDGFFEYTDAGGNVTEVQSDIKVGVDAIQTDLDNSTDGLGALKTLIDIVNTDLSNGTDGLSALKTLIDALNDIAASDVWAVDATGQQTAGTFGQAIGDPGANTETIYDAVVTDAAGTNVAADIIALKAETVLILADTDDIQTRLPSTLISGKMDSDVEAINDNTESAIDLSASARTIVRATVDTVTNSHTPTTTEFQADDVTVAAGDHFNGRSIYFTSGTLKDQGTDITDYVAVGGIGQFTVTALTSAPANNDTFVIV